MREASDHRDTNKILESRVFSAHECHQNYHPPKMADTSKDELLLGGGICHLTATSQYRAHRKQVRASVSNIV